MEIIAALVVLAPLTAACVVGLSRRRLPPSYAHGITIGAVGLALVLSTEALRRVIVHGEVYRGEWYTWLVTDGITFPIGYMVDALSALMMVVVTFISLVVHVYSTVYMKGDEGYRRFFAYIAFFTAAMLLLVISDNFVQLFVGWEAVGLASYLLIGFWYKRDSAILANFKAFIVNRVGDLAFLVGIVAVIAYFHTVQYQDVFEAVPLSADMTLAVMPGIEISVLSLICGLFFVGAMAKSAQIPLHVWLPDSMEGPTPISALIHAATMVTAGIYMVARLSPMYEYAEGALVMIMVIGAATALLLGIVGIVQNDIKRVIAYSTISQLGYMATALGASAYSAAIFHLFTHAFFKALLFLAAGAVIIALHHAQDMRYMGGLRRYMGISYWTTIIGIGALIGIPGFSGFYSKEIIIEAVGASERVGAGFAYVCLVVGTFVTALYSLRLLIMVFHGKERFREHHPGDPREPGAGVSGPLIVLAIPSVLVGGAFAGPIVFGPFFDGAIFVLPANDVLATVQAGFAGPLDYAVHGLEAVPVWLAGFGAVTAWLLISYRPEWGAAVGRGMGPARFVVRHGYGFDALNERILAPLAVSIGRMLWRIGDIRVIDGILVNGTAAVVGKVSLIVRRVQSGYLFHYAFAMILGLLLLLTWMYVR